MNILFVDDQPSVLASLLTSNSWRNYGFTSVFSAPSVAKAKEILQGHSIDILVTDIEMPGEDGLSLINWLQKQRMNTECIILTSHPDFFYAQQAISLHVADYVVQPARAEDIRNAVLRIRDRIQVESAGSQSAVMKPFTKAAHRAALSTFFQDWPSYQEFLDNPNLFDKKMAMMKEFGLDLQEESSTVILCTHIINWLTLPMSPLDFLDAYSAVLAGSAPELGDQAFSYLQKSNTFLSFIWIPDHSGLNLEAIFSNLQQQVHKTLRCEVQLLYAVTEIMETTDCIRVLLQSLDTCHNRLPRQIEAAEWIDTPQANSLESYAQRINQYIDDHIGDPITRTQLAAELFVSPGYVGQIIKLTEGCSCKELITRKKMEYARHLLQKTKISVGDIAAKCGYDHFAYFSKTYKQHWGHSPSAERK